MKYRVIIENDFNSRTRFITAVHAAQLSALSLETVGDTSSYVIELDEEQSEKFFTSARPLEFVKLRGQEVASFDDGIEKALGIVNVTERLDDAFATLGMHNGRHLVDEARSNAVDLIGFFEKLKKVGHLR